MFRAGHKFDNLLDQDTHPTIFPPFGRGLGGGCRWSSPRPAFCPYGRAKHPSPPHPMVYKQDSALNTPHVIILGGCCRPYHSPLMVTGNVKREMRNGNTATANGTHPPTPLQGGGTDKSPYILSLPFNHQLSTINCRSRRSPRNPRAPAH
jgi:hypothetical protein